MNSLGGLIGGVVGGVVGASIWAGISYGTGYEIGWIAWGIGGLVGFGFAVGTRGSGGVHAGIGAVAVTVLSLLGGKYAAVELAIRDELGSKSEFIESAVADLANDELMVSYLADDIIQLRVSRGEPVDWPPGVDPAEADEETEYPPEIWAEAQPKWDRMSGQERQASRDEVAERIRFNVGTYFDEVSKYGFTSSFGMMDLLFFGLAIVTAYQIAGRRATETTEPQESPEEAV